MMKILAILVCGLIGGGMGIILFTPSWPVGLGALFIGTLMYLLLVQKI